MGAETARVSGRPHDEGERRDTRAAVAAICQLRIGSGPWRPASLVDISRSGFRIAWLPQCPIGRRLWVRLPGLEPMPAYIRWRDQRGVGCEFERPLHIAVMEHLARIS
jgi:hypothetical protein